MSPPRAPLPSESAVFDAAPRRSWLVTALIHAGLFGALALISRHPSARQLVETTSVVEFETPPPPPPPPPPEPLPPPPAAAATPPPPRHHAPAPAPRPAEPPPTAAPPPMLTAPSADSRAGDSVPSGTNRDYRGGDTSSTGRGDDGARGDRPAPPTPPAPPPPPSVPIDLPDDATAPEAVDGNEAPEYPESLREAGVQGTVIARFVVRANGSVGDVRVLRGPEELRDTVREALRRWRFRPATVNGHAIAVYRTMPFRFVLDNL